MNGQYFGEQFRTSDSVVRTDQDANSPVENSDPFADKVPVDAADIHETAMGGTVAAVGPLNETPAAEVPLYETPLQEIPMGGTVAAVGPMDEVIGHEEPVVAANPYQAQVVNPLNDESWDTKTIPYKAPVVESIPYKAPVVESITHEVPAGTNAGSAVVLLDRGESEHFRTRWNEIQGKFVDEPRAAVQQADALVSEVIEQITKMFANEHGSLESQWKQGSDVSTEDLRQALQHYRSFFNRLVV